MRAGERLRSPIRGAAWRGPAVALIKLVHTAIFALVSTSILYVFVAGLRGRATRRTAAAVAVVLAEMAVFAGNRFRCPLTGLAEELGAERGRVTDIFLPRWFADRIPQFFMPPFVIGVLALLWHGWRERRAAARPEPGGASPAAPAGRRAGPDGPLASPAAEGPEM